jgi:hypothetical protein
MGVVISFVSQSERKWAEMLQRYIAALPGKGLEIVCLFQIPLLATQHYVASNMFACEQHVACNDGFELDD